MDGDKKDTLLIIAVKINNVKLVEWMLTLDGLDTTKQNGKGLDAMAVAKALGREHLLLGTAASESPSNSTGSIPKGASAAVDFGAPPPPPGKPAADETALEVVRLGNAIKMLKVTPNSGHHQLMMRSSSLLNADVTFFRCKSKSRTDNTIVLILTVCTRQYNETRPMFIRTVLRFAIQANNDDKEAKIAKAEQNCQAYQQMLKEKDANIGELEKKARIFGVIRESRQLHK